MKTKAGIPIAGLAAIALPLVVAVGCAGNQQNVAATDATQDESTQTAIASMDGYMASLEQQQQQENRDEAVEAEVAETVAPAEEDVVQNVDELFEEAALLQETETASAAEEVWQEEEKAVTPTPQQLVFYFGSNSDAPEASDNEALLQHAQYLQQHPNMVLMISGHSDIRGSKTYNQKLSEQRALNVASILLAAGVSGEQLRIDGLGDNVPMTDPGHLQENRRVEFTYLDSMMAQK